MQTVLTLSFLAPFKDQRSSELVACQHITSKGPECQEKPDELVDDGKLNFLYVYIIIIVLWSFVI